jgi:hypothetical protein
MQRLRKTASATLIIIITASLHRRIYIWLLVYDVRRLFCPRLCSKRGGGSPCWNRNQVQQCPCASTAYAGIKTLRYI